LQLYEETESTEAVTEAATALLAKRPSDHVRQVAWFFPPELIRALPKQYRARIVPMRPQLGSSAAAHGAPGSLATTNEPRKAAANLSQR
jgi:hypothetical protein